MKGEKAYVNWTEFANSELSLADVDYAADCRKTIQYMFDHFDDVSHNKLILCDMATIVVDPIGIREIEGKFGKNTRLEWAEIKKRQPDYALICELMSDLQF